MAVVTHGSFDEGPLVLGDGLGELIGTVETDPVFTAWNRSTGITISKSQITDRSNILTTDGVGGTTDISTIVTGSNTGDQDLSGRIPYTGATGNVDLGTNTLDVERVYVNQETPIASTELATKGYVDAKVFDSTGDVTPTIAHNDTTGKEGGGGGHWYHLSDTVNTIIPNITQSDSDTVPTGIALVTSGISLGLDGLAYIILTWDVIASGTFDHYSVEYKKSVYTYYTPLTTQSNTITIEGLTPNTSYDFRVASVNKYGTESAFCDDLVLTTSVDSVAPATVIGVSATGITQAVLLRWTNNTDVDLESYNLYRYTSNNSVSSSIIGNIKGNVYVDNGLTVDTTYYYWIKAKDTSGNLSTSYSTTVSATTQKLPASDIENIAASQVIIQGVTTLANWTSTGVTTIDGSKITTGTVTLAQLNFTPLGSTNVIASINSSPEGIQIDADNFAISGATTFTSKVGGSFTSANSVPRIRIFPNTNIGIEIVDDLGHNVFTAEVGGTNLGDVTIGNWLGGQGIKYDKSAGTTTFAGAIQASSGTIAGITEFGTALSTVDGISSIALKGNDIYENSYPHDYSSIRINRIGYNGGTSYGRNLIAYDGKGHAVILIGSQAGTINGLGGIVVYEEIKINKIATFLGSLNMSGGGGTFFIAPRMTTAQKDAYEAHNNAGDGAIYYNTTVGNFYGMCNGTWRVLYN